MPESTVARKSVNDRVKKRRDALRRAGLRPVQIWVPDTRQPGFARQCRIQSRRVGAADGADPQLQHFLDEALAADQFDGTATATVLLVSGTLVDAPLLRVTVQPDSKNGLQKPSQVMIDKAMTVKRENLGRAFGQIGSQALLEIERRLAVFLGIAK